LIGGGSDVPVVKGADDVLLEETVEARLEVLMADDDEDVELKLDKESEEDALVVDGTLWVNEVVALAVGTGWPLIGPVLLPGGGNGVVPFDGAPPTQIPKSTLVTI
jgi:hypothetical protein